MLTRDSAAVSGRRAAAGLLAGGLEPDEVARAVRRTGARIVHAHNLQPTYGWRALAAARAAGAAVVLHLHQYRLVCAIGVCFRDGHECTRCHGRHTLPGVLLNCRGSIPEAVAYGAGLAAWQRRLAAQADAVIIPSRFAEARLRHLGAPLGPTSVVPDVVRQFATDPPPAPADRYALLAGRLVAEKGVEVAIEACRRAEIRLVIAGEGPERARLQARVDPARVTFAGHLAADALRRVRRSATVALMPSRSAETFGLAAAEAMADGVPAAAAAIGALPELVPTDWLAAPGDAAALADAITRILADPGAPARALDRARAVCAPGVVAPGLAAVYERATAALTAPRRTGRR